MAKQTEAGETRRKDHAAVPPAPPPCQLLEDMRANPQGDWNIKDVETLCGQVGLTLKAPTRGTHYKVKGANVPMILTIPARKPIKPPYIRLLVSMADRVRAGTGAK